MPRGLGFATARSVNDRFGAVTSARSLAGVGRTETFASFSRKRSLPDPYLPVATGCFRVRHCARTMKKIY